MEYSIKKLAALAGISCRTLRHYDAIGLLSPRRISSNGYRIYGQKEVNLLQMILFYRALDMPLEKIRTIVHADHFNTQEALQDHMSVLVAKRNQIDMLNQNVEMSLASGEENGS